MELTENTHYTVEYQKNVEKGTATIIFKGKESGGFTGTKKVSFIIKAKGIQDITSNGITTEQISVIHHLPNIRLR